MSVWLLRKFNARIEILVSFPLVQYIVRINFPNSIYFLLLLYYYFTDMSNFSLYIYLKNYVLLMNCYLLMENMVIGVLGYERAWAGEDLVLGQAYR